MNPETELIRPMTTADLSQVREIANSLKEAPQWPETAYRVALDPDSGPRRLCLVAEAAEDGVVGFAVACLVGDQAELETIAVAREWQRRGLARRLFGAIRGKCESVGITEVILEVRGSNQPARGLYHAAGFREAGRRPGYYADPEEDAILMNLRLK